MSGNPGDARSRRNVKNPRRHRRRVVPGAPDTVKARLLEPCEWFEADELMVVTITRNYRARLESYELIAGAFALCQPA